jgi:hypothetical protein
MLLVCLTSQPQGTADAVTINPSLILNVNTQYILVMIPFDSMERTVGPSKGK